MNQALKQRLVGAVVLVALAVIFLPAIFNGGRHVQVEVLKPVPPMPKVASLQIKTPVRPQGSGDETPASASDMYSMEAKPMSTMEKIQTITQTSTVSTKPELNSQKHPNAWVLQVGVFSEKNKADALKKQLQAKGYRAFTRSVMRDNNADGKKSVTRVLIGPNFEKSALVKMKTVVDKDFSVDSRVIEFKP